MTLGEFSMLLGMVGAFPYIWQIIRGRVRPERVTWFVWTVIMVLAVYSYRASGATDSVWLLVGDLAVTATIFLLSLWRGSGGWTRLDVTCLCIAAASLSLWQLSSVPLFAVWGVLVADVVALIPTLVKSLRDPLSESPSTYLFSSLAAICGFAAVGHWSFTLLFYPAYLFAANLITGLVVAIGQYHVNRLQIEKGHSA